MPCKRVFLSIGAPLGNLEGIRLPGLFEGKDQHIWVPFLVPEDVNILGNVVLRRKPQSTFCVSVRPWPHSDIHIWVPSLWTLRLSGNYVQGLVTSEIRRKIQMFVNRCLRYILRIWWPNIISNKDLWRVTDQEDINLEIRKENLDGLVTH